MSREKDETSEAPAAGSPCDVCGRRECVATGWFRGSEQHNFEWVEHYRLGYEREKARADAAEKRIEEILRNAQKGRLEEKEYYGGLVAEERRSALAQAAYICEAIGADHAALEVRTLMGIAAEPPSSVKASDSAPMEGLKDLERAAAARVVLDLLRRSRPYFLAGLPDLKRGHHPTAKALAEEYAAACEGTAPSASAVPATQMGAAAPPPSVSQDCSHWTYDPTSNGWVPALPSGARQQETEQKIKDLRAASAASLVVNLCTCGVVTGGLVFHRPDCIYATDEQKRVQRIEELEREGVALRRNILRPTLQRLQILEEQNRILRGMTEDDYGFRG